MGNPHQGEHAGHNEGFESEVLDPITAIIPSMKRGRATRRGYFQATQSTLEDRGAVALLETTH
jgi:hypothetical protein